MACPTCIELANGLSVSGNFEILTELHRTSRNSLFGVDWMDGLHVLGKLLTAKYITRFGLCVMCMRTNQPMHDVLAGCSMSGFFFGKVGAEGLERAYCHNS